MGFNPTMTIDTYIWPNQGGRHSSSGYIHRGHQRLPRYNKDEFLQANFRFLVSDAVDIQTFTAEADKMFEWEDIAQVRILEVIVITATVCMKLSSGFFSCRKKYS